MSAADLMRVWAAPAPGRELIAEDRPLPSVGENDVLIRVRTCGVCRTDLHVRDGELPDVTYPIVPGHQVVGDVAAAGEESPIAVGERVGVAWLGWTCGDCRYCKRGQENLCDRARFHGYHVDGGYAEYMRADARFCFVLDPQLDPVVTAPLLCAGLIGFRSLRLAGDADRIGLYGFGSAAHIVTQVARHAGQSVFAFTSPGDAAAQRFALEVGAEWAGGSDQDAPCELDAAIIFAPVGPLVPKALRDVRKGGSVVCGGIHMSDIPGFPYADLWGERIVRSVANLTRQDGYDFMALAAQGFMTPRVTTYPLEDANRALADLADGRLNGSAVLTVT
jgi:propanol-preferring alcohol dehydrogenase